MTNEEMHEKIKRVINEKGNLKKWQIDWTKKSISRNDKLTEQKSQSKKERATTKWETECELTGRLNTKNDDWDETKERTNIETENDKWRRRQKNWRMETDKGLTYSQLK
jgi:hypothetical protein